MSCVYTCCTRHHSGKAMAVVADSGKWLEMASMKGGLTGGGSSGDSEKIGSAPGGTQAIPQTPFCCRAPRGDFSLGVVSIQVYRSGFLSLGEHQVRLSRWCDRFPCVATDPVGAECSSTVLLAFFQDPLSHSLVLRGVWSASMQFVLYVGHKFVNTMKKQDIIKRICFFINIGLAGHV